MTSSSHQSPARIALASHLGAVQEASSQMAAARTRVDRYRAQSESAEIALRAAQSRLNDIAERETGALRQWSADGAVWPPPASPTLEKERAQANGSAAEAQRAVDALKGLVAEAEREFSEPARTLAELTARGPEIVLGALADEVVPAAEGLCAAIDGLVKAEAELNGLGVFLAARARSLRDKGDAVCMLWFRAAERVAEAADRILRPIPTTNEVNAAAARWAAFTERLATDSGAQLKD